MVVRTRFAPSPTGYLHIGGVRTALFNWLFARQNNGQFILRIDDTDGDRNVEDTLRPILDGFRWLGLDWDEGPDVGGEHAPYFQSQRADRYRNAAAALVADGFAYRDFARPEEVQAERQAAEKEQRPFVYSRRWMAESEEQAAAFAKEGRQPVIRLKMPRSGTCQFDDEIRGNLEFEWAHEQDHVIQRTDGSCLYHLANVVDDEAFKITHVIRAVEHLSNTPRQIFIAESLGFSLPTFAHLPYVAEPGSSNKLSKRKLAKYLKNREFLKLFEHGQKIAEEISLPNTGDTFNPVIVDFYREVGYLSAAIVNYLLLLGWSFDDKKESFTREEMVRDFSLARVNKSPASFDPQKLWAFQLRYMQELPLKQKVAMVLPFLQKAGLVAVPPPCDIATRIQSVVQAAGDRIRTAGDILEFREFFVADADLEFDEKAFQKRIIKPQAANLLNEFRQVAATVDPFDAATVEQALRTFVAEKEIKIGDIIHALRVAVTGKPAGVGMFEALEIIGAEATGARIDRAIETADAAVQQ